MSKKLAVVVTATVVVGKGEKTEYVSPRADGRPQLLDADVAQYVVDNGAGRFPQSVVPADGNDTGNDAGVEGA